MAKAMKWKPSLQILGIPAIFLKTERTVVPHEDIDAMVACGTVEGNHDANGHGNYVRCKIVLRRLGSFPSALTLARARGMCTVVSISIGRELNEKVTVT